MDSVNVDLEAGIAVDQWRMFIRIIAMRFAEYLIAGNEGRCSKAI